MPEVIRKLDVDRPPSFRAGEGKGGVFSALPQDVKDGYVRAHARQTVLVAPQALYELWRDVEAAPLWMEYVVSVTASSDKLSHWVFGNPEEPEGKRIEYDSEITADEPGRRIAWRSIDSEYDESGEVTFEPSFNGRGTVVTLMETVKAPGGAAGNALAGLVKRSPRQIVIEDLRHFKQLAESGEIPSVVGQPNGPRGFVGTLKSKLYGENNPTPEGTSSLS